MSYKERHEEIANKFAKLNDDLEDIKEEYLEKISSNINQAVKDYKNKDLWKKSYDKTVDLFYEALTKTYL
ncbi:MAG: hypothetical protein IJ880_08620 [Bacilli bacterium]|nr:hypothetical protein [Bacilli bacterium]